MIPKRVGGGPVHLSSSGLGAQSSPSPLQSTVPGHNVCHLRLTTVALAESPCPALKQVWRPPEWEKGGGKEEMSFTFVLACYICTQFHSIGCQALVCIFMVFYLGLCMKMFATFSNVPCRVKCVNTFKHAVRWDLWKCEGFGVIFELQ